MGESHKITVNKCINFHHAVNLVADNQLIGGRTTYKLARLNDAIISIIKSYYKAQLIGSQEVEKNTKVLESETKLEGKTQEEIDILNKQIQDIKDTHANTMNEILQSEEKDVKIPNFVLSEFISKVDETSLVPPSFFYFMGTEYIKDDFLDEN